MRDNGKKTGRARAPRERDTEDVLRESRKRLEDELVHLRKLRKSIDEALDADITPALVREIVRESTGVSRALVQVSAELRKYDKHETAALMNVSKEEKDQMMIEWLEDLPLEDRLMAAEVLKKLNKREKLLG